MDRNKTPFVILNLAVIAALALLLTNILTIRIVHPAQQIRTDDRTPLFTWSGMQGNFTLSLDDNPDFTSPETAVLQGNSHTFDKELEFGTYYWKVESGPLSSGVGRFTVVSSVVLSRDEESVKNEGNTEVILTGPSITGAFVLGTNESFEIGAEEHVRAEQN